jgi:hypothetical protein
MTFRRVYADLLARVMANIRETETGCWEWTRRTSHNGYPLLNYREDGKHKTVRVHRWLFEKLAGIVLPPKIEIDHKCHNTRCIRPGPEHCMPVTKAENLANRRGYATRYTPETVNDF